MRIHFFRAIFALWFVVAAAAQGPGDLAYLLDGVKEIAPGRYGGVLCVFGDRAFPVVDGRSESGALEPMMAAARFEKGRLVAFGHANYLDDDLFGLVDTARLISNAARWASGEKPAPRLGVYKTPGLAARLRRIGLDAREITLNAPNVDVISLLPRYVDDGEVALLSKYIRGGGGLVAGAVGWIVQRRDPDKDLATDFAGNRLLAPAGVVWATGNLSATSKRGFTATPLPAELSHARKALDAAIAYSTHKRALSAGELKQVSATLTRAVLSLPPDDKLLIPRLDALPTAVPSERRPVAQNDVLARVAIARDVVRLRHAAPDRVTAHPAAAEFPGSVPKAAPRVALDVPVRITGGRWGRFGTGLYAAPGEVITVKVPHGVAKKGLRVIIGAHTDPLWHLEKWLRVPEISFDTLIQQPETRAANAFGGLIYIAAP